MRRRLGVIVALGAFSVAANGVITSLSLHGHVLVNVCAALT